MFLILESGSVYIEARVQERIYKHGLPALFEAVFFSPGISCPFFAGENFHMFREPRVHIIYPVKAGGVADPVRSLPVRVTEVAYKIISEHVPQFVACRRRWGGGPVPNLKRKNLTRHTKSKHVMISYFFIHNQNPT